MDGLFSALLDFGGEVYQDQADSMECGLFSGVGRLGDAKVSQLQIRHLRGSLRNAAVLIERNGVPQHGGQHARLLLHRVAALLAG